MDFEQAIEEIKTRWLEVYPRDKQNKNPGIICPLCGSGSGANGSGVKLNPHSSGHSLKCFACGAAGDIIDFYSKAEGKEFKTSVQELADKLNIKIERTQAPQRAETKKDDKIIVKTEKEQIGANLSLIDYTEFYSICNKALDDERAITYLHSRGIGTLTAKKYNLGFCPNWKSPKKEREGEKAPESARLIIPISKNHYLARSVDPENKLRYLDETGNGNKGLFNVQAIKPYDICFVVEGVFDALSVIEAGQENVLALNSTADKNLFIELAKKNPETLFLLALDNDESGKKASAEIYEALKTQLIHEVNICGSCKDPNEALTKEPELFGNDLLKISIDARNELAMIQKKTLRPDSVANYLEDAFKQDLTAFQSCAHVKTGFAELDGKSGGLFPGLYVLGAASGLGKTTFALQMCDNLAAAGHEVIYFSLEQSKMELVSKSLSRLRAQGKGERITSMQIRNGANVTEEIETYKQIAEKLNIVEANMQCNSSFIGNYLREYQKRNKTRTIAVVDYLQILGAPTDTKTTDTKSIVDANITNLKRISRELGATIIVISSINRNNYHLPIDFEALKESGGVEFSADVVWGLQLRILTEQSFIDEKKEPIKRQIVKEEMKKTPRQIDLVCLKNRYGAPGYTCELNYTPAYDLFEESFIDARNTKRDYPF